MARRKEAVREQQAVVGARQATLAQELRKQSTVTATKKLRTMFQVSKIPKQPTRKVALDVVVPTHPSTWLVKLHAISVKSNDTISQCVDQSQIWQQ